jgi:hypothetical protein
MRVVAAAIDNPHQDALPAGGLLAAVGHTVAVAAVVLATTAAGMVEVMRWVVEVRQVAAGMGLWDKVLGQQERPRFLLAQLVTGERTCS